MSDTQQVTGPMGPAVPVQAVMGPNQPIESPRVQQTLEEVAARINPVVQAAAPAVSNGPKRAIQYRPLSELHGDPRNPKAHRQDLIDESFNRFGVIDPIAIDGRTDYIISGHGRALALQDAFASGQPTPEGVEVSPTGEWLIPVYTGWSSKNDTEAAAALISMNKLTESGGWEDAALLALLEQISESGVGFGGVGYDESELDDLRAYLASEDAAVNFDPVTANAQATGADTSDAATDLTKINLSAGQTVVNVVLMESDRDKLYDLLHGIAWILDVRNSRQQ